MSTVIRANERSWAISLISDINIMLQHLTLKICCAGGESTVSTGHQSMFPDVLLYGDESQTQILQGWELKMPDTLITDNTFIYDAERKARSLGLNSFFIWNFTAGVLYVKEYGQYKIAKQWNNTNHITTRNDVAKHKQDWVSAIREILIEINAYLISGIIKGASLGAIISDSIVATIIERNKQTVSRTLHKAAVSDAKMQAAIDVWWDEIKTEFSFDEKNQFDAYAKILLLNWANRIVFAHLIKYSHNAALDVENIDFKTSVCDADKIFLSITERCDFYNIFHGMNYNNYITEEAWHDIIDLNVFLTKNGLKKIQQSSLQSILEKTVDMSKRELNGQFTTPVILADILVRLTVHNWESNIIDPCCGTGSIPQAVIENKMKRLTDTKKCIETTWASDKFSFPLQIANISLTNAETINMPNRIFQSNVFELSAGKMIEIVNPTDGQIINVEMPYFDVVNSNLPFIPFEKIDNNERAIISAIASDIQLESGIVLSERNDYYSYIIFALRKILTDSGRIGVITSNSWLGTLSGQQFFKALRYFFNVEQLHISNTTRWFDNAQVITLILLLSKKTEMDENPSAKTIFAKWNKSLIELKNEDLKSKLINSSILEQELDASVVSLLKYSACEIEKVLKLSVSISALFHDILWLLDIEDKLIRIEEVFTVVRGERRGWDKLFYPEKGHKIESSYIKKVLKSAKNVKSLIAEPDFDAFCCSKSLEELEALNHYGAVKWIHRFINEPNEVGIPLTQSLKRKDMYWYEMKDSSTADIVTTMNPDKRLFFSRFDEPTFINQRLIGLKCRNEYSDRILNHALLNSIIGMFYIEAVGFGRGLGALDFNSKTIRKAFMLNPKLVEDSCRIEIIEKFTPLLSRNVYPTAQELNLQDRLDFDLAVLKAYGIESYYESIKTSLLSMQSMRLGI